MWVSIKQLNELLETFENSYHFYLTWLSVTKNSISLNGEELGVKLVSEPFLIENPIIELPAINIKEIQNLLDGEMEFRYFNDGSWYILNSSLEDECFEIEELCVSLKKFSEFETKLLEDLITF